MKNVPVNLLITVLVAALAADLETELLVNAIARTTREQKDKVRDVLDEAKKTKGYPGQSYSCGKTKPGGNQKSSR